ncbi:DUF3969 family protein [Deinococcus sp. QL22]|uniref:DUF3969 family protein n=1 Tax=Deinococcus sp. QL22 TaxID=2939437 RepID=UPI0020176054|nr:hypothetical protein [Deinococcus sp. QL22]UQN09884.1 hypothetical protein M1R55_27315 [Deinococcus sp. QL22]
MLTVLHLGSAILLNLHISVHPEDMAQLGKVLLFQLLGVLDAVEQGLVSTTEAERYCLNPFRNRKFAELGIRTDVLEIFERSGFLDDAQRLGTTSFSSSCTLLREAIGQGLRARAATHPVAHLNFQLEERHEPQP